jgi:hypothetical protein
VTCYWDRFTLNFILFYIIGKEDIPFIKCMMSLRGPKFMRKVDGSSLISFDLHVPALMTRFNSIEILLQLSENINLFAVTDWLVLRFFR